MRVSGMWARTMVREQNQDSCHSVGGERHPKPTVGVKIVIIAAAAVVPHWRPRAGIDALNIRDERLLLEIPPETGVYFC